MFSSYGCKLHETLRKIEKKIQESLRNLKKSFSIAVARSKCRGGGGVTCETSDIAKISFSIFNLSTGLTRLDISQCIHVYINPLPHFPEQDVSIQFLCKLSMK